MRYGNTLYETMMSDIGNDLAYARKLTVTGFPVYGSSRLGEKQANKLVYNTSFAISGVDGEGTLLPDSVLLSETELIDDAHWHYSSACDQTQLLTFYVNDMVIERIKHAAQPRAKGAIRSHQLGENSNVGI